MFSKNKYKFYGIGSLLIYLHHNSSLILIQKDRGKGPMTS